jgi:hypothetical protein
VTTCSQCRRLGTSHNETPAQNGAEMPFLQTRRKCLLAPIQARSKAHDGDLIPRQQSRLKTIGRRNYLLQTETCTSEIHSRRGVHYFRPMQVFVIRIRDTPRRTTTYRHRDDSSRLLSEAEIDGRAGGADTLLLNFAVSPLCWTAFETNADHYHDRRLQATLNLTTA